MINHKMGKLRKYQKRKKECSEEQNPKECGNAKPGTKLVEFTDLTGKKFTVECDKGECAGKPGDKAIFNQDNYKLQVQTNLMMQIVLKQFKQKMVQDTKHRGLKR